MITTESPQVAREAERRPRWERCDFFVLIAYLLAAHAVFYPALRPGVFLYGRDSVAHDFALLLYNWSLIADQGQLGLWNPHLFCGLPSLGTFASCPFYPITGLFAILSPGWAFTYQYVLNDWLAGVGTYWAARQMGLRRVGAGFAGLVFMVCGHVVTLAHAGHLQKLAAIAWLPFAFGCATAAMKERRWRFWLGCGVALAMQLLASHMQIAYYTVLFLLLWTIWLAVARKGMATPNRRFATPTFVIGGWFLSFAVAIGISAGQVLPAMETAPLTNRGAGIPFEAAAETSYPPLEFMEYLLPSFLGDSTENPRGYKGQWGERIVTDYMGLLPILLLFFALVTARDRQRWFWLAVIIVTAVLAAGRHTPVFRVAYDWLPGLNRFRSPATIMVFIAWPASILAAMGLEAFAQRAASDTNAQRRYLLVLLTAAGAFALLFLVLAVPAIQWPVLGSVSSPIERATDSPTATIWASLRRSFFFAGLSCLALATLAATSRLSRQTAEGREISRKVRMVEILGLCVVLAVAFVDPRLHESRYVKRDNLRRFQVFLLSHWSDSILRDLPEPARGIETGNELTNRMMTRGIGSLHGYHPVHLQTYVDLLDLYAQNHPQLGRLAYEQFVLAPEGRSPGREYERRATEERQVLWLRRPPLLYAYFPREIAVFPGQQSVLAAMARPDFDSYRCSYALDPTLDYRASENSTASARVLYYSPDRIDLEVTSDEPRPMIIAELAAPGWQWTAAPASLAVGSQSAQRLPMMIANYAFRATRIPAGSHQITLLYRPFSFRLGLYLTFMTSLILLAVLLLGQPTSSRDNPRP